MSHLETSHLMTLPPTTLPTLHGGEYETNRMHYHHDSGHGGYNAYTVSQPSDFSFQGTSSGSGQLIAALSQQYIPINHSIPEFGPNPSYNDSNDMFGPQTTPFPSNYGASTSALVQKGSPDGDKSTQRDLHSSSRRSARIAISSATYESDTTPGPTRQLNSTRSYSGVIRNTNTKPAARRIGRRRRSSLNAPVLTNSEMQELRRIEALIREYKWFIDQEMEPPLSKNDHTFKKVTHNTRFSVFMRRLGNFWFCLLDHDCNYTNMKPTRTLAHIREWFEYLPYKCNRTCRNPGWYVTFVSRENLEAHDLQLFFICNKGAASSPSEARRGRFICLQFMVSISQGFMVTFL